MISPPSVPPTDEARPDQIKKENIFGDHILALCIIQYFSVVTKAVT